LELIIIWIICGIAGAVIGANKNAGCAGFTLGFLLGPIGLLIAIFMKGDRLPCPACREYISTSATKCPKCGSDISRGKSVGSSTEKTSLPDNDTKKCPACAELIKLEAIKCRYCGTDFDPAIVSQQCKQLLAKDIRKCDVCPRCGSKNMYYDFGGSFCCRECQIILPSSQAAAELMATNTKLVNGQSSFHDMPESDVSTDINPQCPAANKMPATKRKQMVIYAGIAAVFIVLLIGFIFFTGKAPAPSTDDSPKGIASFTPLMEAASLGKLPEVSALLDKGADVNAQNADGYTALMVAALQGHADVVLLLIDKGADVNIKNGYGVTALWAVAGMGHPNVVRVLLDKGADVNTKNRNGVTALAMAAIKGHADEVSVFLSKGADVNTTDINGVTALMAAAALDHADVVRILLGKGADVNIKNNMGETALNYAMKEGHANIVSLINNALEHKIGSQKNYAKEKDVNIRDWRQERARQITTPQIKTHLSDGITAYNNKRYKYCITAMDKVLELDETNLVAADYKLKCLIGSESDPSD
jgi:hypothetical protein